MSIPEIIDNVLTLDERKAPPRVVPTGGSKTGKVEAGTEE